MRKISLGVQVYGTKKFRFAASFCGQAILSITAAESNSVINVKKSVFNALLKRNPSKCFCPRQIACVDIEHRVIDLNRACRSLGISISSGRNLALPR